MAKPNYSFEKRQRELAKKKKKEEKLKEKAERKSHPGENPSADPDADGEVTEGSDAQAGSPPAEDQPAG